MCRKINHGELQLLFEKIGLFCDPFLKDNHVGMTAGRDWASKQESVQFLEILYCLLFIRMLIIIIYR